MMCESCSQTVATVHLTEMSDGEKNETHLCESCAQEKGITIKHHFSTSNLPGLVDAKVHQAIKQLSSILCPHCGISYGEFRRKGRLGCAHDYSFFRSGLEPLLEKIHAGTEHVGKVPTRVSLPYSDEPEVDQLERLLQEAVETEAYERAAELRDQIKELNEQADGHQ